MTYLEDLLLYAVDYARNLGAEYAEARYHRLSSMSITSRNGMIIGSGSETSEGVAIRVMYDGSLAFASTHSLKRSDVTKAVEKAVSNAKAGSKLMKLKLKLSDDIMGSATYEVKPKKSFDSISIDDKISMHKDLFKQAQKTIRDSSVSLQSFIFNYSEELEEKTVVNSDGAYVRSATPRIEGFINIILSNPQKGTIQKWFGIGGSGGFEVIEESNLFNEVANTVGILENILLKGVEPPKDPVDLVLGSEVVGLIMHESVGHPMEADRILGREAAQAGESYVKPDQVGRLKVGNEYATVIDDPTIPGSLGFYLYDDEGVPARPKYLYYKGILNEPLHNRSTARVFGTRSNASSRAKDFESEPIVRMSNTYLAPGDRSFEELIEDIEFGIYIKSYMEWNIDDTRWAQRYGGLEAYLIERGELTKLVRNPVIEFTTGWFFKNIVATDSNLRFYPGTCGKGEPMQGIPVWFGGPNVRLGKIKLGVAPK